MNFKTPMVTSQTDELVPIEVHVVAAPRVWNINVAGGVPGGEPSADDHGVRFS